MLCPDRESLPKEGDCRFYCLFWVVLGNFANEEFTFRGCSLPWLLIWVRMLSTLGRLFLVCFWKVSSAESDSSLASSRTRKGLSSGFVGFLSSLWIGVIGLRRPPLLLMLSLGELDCSACLGSVLWLESVELREWDLSWAWEVLSNFYSRL